MSSKPRSARESVSRYAWENLKQAHLHLRSARVTDGMDAYAQVIPKIWEYAANANHLWRAITYQTDSPSWNWASAYLREYFYVRQTWFGWNQFSSGLFEKQHWQHVPFSCQSQLISTMGWASIRKRGLRKIISDQLAFLDDGRWAKENQQPDFLKSLHFMVLSYAHTLAFEDLRAFKYAHLAIERLDPQIEPFYAIRAREILGTAFYTFGQYEQALHCYSKSADIIQSVGPSADPLLPYYGEGWAYIGSRQLENALRVFRAGYQVKARFALYYEAARCKYGEGYTLFLLGSYDEAIRSLYEALRVFCDDHFDLNIANNENSIVSPAMAAACSHVIALVHERQGELGLAIKHEAQAIDWQRTIEDPGQLSDMLRRAAKVNLQSLRLINAVGYLFEFLLLRLRYRVPTLSFE